jgi:hypothetical protein
MELGQKTQQASWFLCLPSGIYELDSLSTSDDAPVIELCPLLTGKALGEVIPLWGSVSGRLKRVLSCAM